MYRILSKHPLKIRIFDQEKTPYHLQSSSEKRRFPHKDEDITGFGGTSTKGLESLQWFTPLLEIKLLPETWV